MKWLGTVPDIDHNEQWWNEANTNKNNGFYVNVINNKWQFPNQITKEDYEKSHKIVSEIIELVQILPQIETNTEMQEHYQKIKKIQEDFLPFHFISLFATVSQRTPQALLPNELFVNCSKYSNMETGLILTGESYEKNPIVKSLIKLFPGGSAVDAYVTVQLNNMKAARAKAFFDALNNGTLELSENIINSNDFLYSFYSTLNYVSRTRTEEKVKKFANIVLQLAAENIDFNEFEDYTSVLNELSEREFAILAIKHSYEQRFLHEVGETEYRINGEVQNPKQITNLYWSNFKNEVIQNVGIDPADFNPMLIRLQRTGCYSVHKGYWDEQLEEDGNTTALFKKIMELVSI